MIASANALKATAQGSATSASSIAGICRCVAPWSRPSVPSANSAAPKNCSGAPTKRSPAPRHRQLTNANATGIKLRHEKNRLSRSKSKMSSPRNMPAAASSNPVGQAQCNVSGNGRRPMQKPMHCSTKQKPKSADCRVQCGWRNLQPIVGIMPTEKLSNKPGIARPTRVDSVGNLSDQPKTLRITRRPGHMYPLNTLSLARYSTREKPSSKIR
mmetsp:Transcript_41970/g.121673  ORF Transcript_41970/g.121673 Transcript_41970/m.121673 type:complete len:213 (+) Transcript_41970:1097-1735(+)